MVSLFTRRLYRDDPYLLDFEASVLARREHQGRPAVLLDQTAFYAESGGQPWDVGTLNATPVVAVIEAGAEILHVLDGPLPEDRVRGRVDGERRLYHRQQHHGQHLLSRAFLERHGAETVSFHLGAEACSIDLDREVSQAEAQAAEARANAVVWEARPIKVRTLSREAARALGAKVPDEAGDEVRMVEAEGFDDQPCGGTHPRSTSEVGLVFLLARDRYKGGSRIRFVCGHRALLVLHERNAVLDRVAGQLSAAPLALPEAVARLLEQLAESERRGRDRLEKALAGEARELLARAPSSPPLVVAAFERRDPEELRALANQLLAQGPCVALLGSRSDKAQLLFAQSEGLTHDIPGLLRQAAELLGGRGGGRGNMAQGGGPRVENLPGALARAAELVRGAVRSDRP